MPTLRPDPAAFLRTFFSAPNRLRIESKPEILSWADRLRGSDPLVSVLPCWREDGAVDWYGLAFDDRQFHALGEGLAAFVGPTYSTFRGLAAHLDPMDAIDAAVQAFTSGRTYKFRGAEPKDVWLALERMRRTWARRGPRALAAPQPVGRVLRDFYMAVRAHEAGDASSALASLRKLHHLDAVNLLFLRVQMLGAFRDWGGLLALPELGDIFHLRRPSAVTETLLLAVYHVHLARFEDPPDPEGAVEVFRNSVFPRYAVLFRTRAGMHAAEVLKAFVVAAAAEVATAESLRGTIAARDDLSANDRQYMARVAALWPSSGTSALPGEILARAAAAIVQCDYDEALALALDAPRSITRTRVLCECAYELDTLDAKAAAIEAVRNLEEGERVVFLSRRTNYRLWESLAEPEDVPRAALTVPEVIPSDWCTWLDHVVKHDGRHGSREIARRAATEWSVLGLVGSADIVEQFVERLNRPRTAAADQCLRDSLPHLLAFLERDLAWPNPSCRSLYSVVLELLVLGEGLGRADLIVFGELLEAVLRIGVSDREYADLLMYVRAMWSRYAATATLGWILDCIALFVAFPCSDPASRLGLFHEVLDRMVACRRLLALEQWDLLRLAAVDLGVLGLFERYFPLKAEQQPSVDDPMGALDGKTIAIYTLTERSAQRFKQIVEARIPSVTIVHLHDLDASKRLRQYARQADLFVLVATSATHAATDCVQANRPKDLPTLRPAGRGVASMLEALRTHLS